MTHIYNTVHFLKFRFGKYRYSLPGEDSGEPTCEPESSINFQRTLKPRDVEETRFIIRCE